MSDSPDEGMADVSSQPPGDGLGHRRMELEQLLCFHTLLMDSLRRIQAERATTSADNDASAVGDTSPGNGQPMYTNLIFRMYLNLWRVRDLARANEYQLALEDIQELTCDESDEQQLWHEVGYLNACDSVGNFSGSPPSPALGSNSGAQQPASSPESQAPDVLSVESSGELDSEAIGNGFAQSSDDLGSIASHEAEHMGPTLEIEINGHSNHESDHSDFIDPSRLLWFTQASAAFPDWRTAAHHESQAFRQEVLEELAGRSATLASGGAGSQSLSLRSDVGVSATVYVVARYLGIGTEEAVMLAQHEINESLGVEDLILRLAQHRFLVAEADSATESEEDTDLD